MNNILTINNLCKSYNSLSGEILTISNLSLDIKEGEFLSIVGSSGCGKSTLLNILSGLDGDYSGKIRFSDNVKSSYMLQEDSLFPWLTVYQNATLGLKIQKKLTKENEEYVMHLLDKYGLHDFVNKKINSLSGGMRQRVV